MDVARPSAGPAERGLEAYGRLIKMLMPRAQSIAIYGANGSPLWVADGQDDPDLQKVASEFIKGRPGSPNDIDGVSREFDGALAYVFALRGDSGAANAAVGLFTREGDEARPLSLVQALLRPALDCLQRELLLRNSLAAVQHSLESRDKDLELLFDATLGRDDPAREADELGRLVQAAVDHLGCAIGALIVPERAIALVRTPRDQPKGKEAEIVTLTHRHLLSWAQLQRRTLLVNKVATTNDKMPPFKILSVPALSPSNRVLGFLAFYNRADGADFGDRDDRIATLMVRKVAPILAARYDAATGLLARGAFEQAVEAVLAARTSDAVDSVIYFDLDRTHVINDNFGMHVGDEIIAKVADVVRRRAPVGALTTRIGGDRFALFLPGKTPDQAAGIAEGVREGVAELSHARNETTVNVSVSAGVALLPPDTKSALAHALATAETASKAAKDHGRDRVENLESGEVTLARRNSEVQAMASLREAINAGRFRLYAQPILPLTIGPSAPRFEILVRLQTEDGELQPPAKFLPIAERFEMMPEIDRWVVEHALKELHGHATMLKGRIARFTINLSQQSLAAPETMEFIETQLRSTEVPSDVIAFEVTEAAAVSNLVRTQTFMNRLSLVGCQFVLDRFGTGSMSPAGLHGLPVSMLKIDGSFVRDSLTNTRSVSIIKAIAQLARSLEITTVAEYVETDELRMRMTDLGIDYGQGFAIGKPVPLGEALQDLSLYELMSSGTGAAEQAFLPESSLLAS